MADQRTPEKDKQTPVSGEARRCNPGRSARSTPNVKLAVKTRSMRLRKKQRKEEVQVDVGEGEEGEEEVFSREPGQDDAPPKRPKLQVATPEAPKPKVSDRDIHEQLGRDKFGIVYKVLFKKPYLVVKEQQQNA
ncbi:uncharacterized protein [Amphiura filiformis]|uniref:uncharacterized protein n=1 Tax=Amphiura filiformis TaxID=82378 RepID=UPI003B223E25